MSDSSIVSVLRYVATVDAVKRAMSNLVAAKLHEHLPGYLAVYQTVAGGQDRVRTSDLVAFYDRYMSIGGSTSNKPYVQCFMSRGSRPRLQNRNVSGSYSASSIRNQGRLVGVVDVHGEKTSIYYTLPSDHAKQASAALLRGSRIPVASMAFFMFRNVGFDVDQPAADPDLQEARTVGPTVDELVRLFRDEFFLREQVASEKAVYDKLFVDDRSGYAARDFELSSAQRLIQ